MADSKPPHPRPESASGSAPDPAKAKAASEVDIEASARLLAGEAASSRSPTPSSHSTGDSSFPDERPPQLLAGPLRGYASQVVNAGDVDGDGFPDVAVALTGIATMSQVPAPRRVTADPLTVQAAGVAEAKNTGSPEGTLATTPDHPGASIGQASRRICLS
jgi:hypothetical protein